MNAEDTEAAILRIRKHAGHVAAPQARSPDSAPHLLTEAERAAILPRDATALRIIGNAWPSKLTATERWNRLPEATRRVLANHQAATGFKHVPESVTTIKG